jgi:hypothetical protein
VSRESKPRKRKKDKQQVVGFVGVGLDGADGHQRLTENGFFLLMGGSESTHERMQDVSIRFTESLERRGKELSETSAEEVIEIFYRAADS